MEGLVKTENRKAFVLVNGEAEFFTGFKTGNKHPFVEKLGDAQLYTSLRVAQHFKGIVCRELDESSRVREVTLSVVCDV